MVATRDGKRVTKSFESPANRGGSRAGRGNLQCRCFKCHQVGHRAADCRKNNEDSSASTEGEVPDESFTVYSGAAIACRDEKRNKGNGDQQRVNWILDSGGTSHLCGDQERVSRRNL